MAQNNDGGFHPSSPHSPSEVPDSFKGTPDTRLTAFSPEDGSSKCARLSLGLVLGGTETHNRNLPAGNDRSGPNLLADKDPFVTNLPAASRPLQKLSPTACAFQPFPVKPQLQSGSPQSSVPSHHDVQALSTNLSKDMGISRYLVATSSSKTISTSDVEIYLTGTVTRHGNYYVFPRLDGVYLAFTDIRDAFRAFEEASNHLRDWAVQYITAAEFFNQVGNDANNELTFDGVLNIVAFTTQSTQLEPHAAAAVVRRALHSYGPVFAHVDLSGFESGSMRAIIEFCDLGAAAAATAGCNGASFNGIHISTFPSRFTQVATRPWAIPENTRGGTPPATHTNDLHTSFQNLGITGGGHLAAQSGPLPIIPPSTRNFQPIGVPVHPFMVPFLYQPQFQAGLSYIVDRSPQNIRGSVAGSPFMGPIFAQPTFPFHNTGDYSTQQHLWGFGSAENRRQHATRVNRGPHYNTANHHNHVDVERIRGGQDVRTTIMLRNIPNKVTQADLKQIVDQSSLGKYDFMYLRIDFANDCNVGYAFINFVDPLDIVDFVRARANQRWNCYKSDKVAEISYATIQGKDCLVQKFRNSSVMLEAPHYRPKLYYTFNGPNPLLAGEEEPFPEPDNASKMKRSCENAEHVGLFTPNAGQHFRDEQRRRRSQFDRGTRLAALEEYDYEAASMQSMMYSTR